MYLIHVNAGAGSRAFCARAVRATSFSRRAFATEGKRLGDSTCSGNGGKWKIRIYGMVFALFDISARAAFVTLIACFQLSYPKFAMYTLANSAK